MKGSERITISLPPELRQFIRSRTGRGQRYTTSSEYLRNLVLEDMARVRAQAAPLDHEALLAEADRARAMLERVLKGLATITAQHPERKQQP